MNALKKKLAGIGILCILATGTSIQAAPYNPLKLFTDLTCSELKPEVSARQVSRCKDEVLKRIASAMLEGTYDPAFRIQEYGQYQHPDIMGRINKTNAYSLLDNATGIVARKGKELIVAVGNTGGDSIGIKIQNLMNLPAGDGYKNTSSEYSLSEGINRITPKNDGLIYVLYHTTQAHSDKKVKIHFLTGEVNGYFDIQKHEPSQWGPMLENASYEYFDVLGKYTHLTFPTHRFVELTPDGKSLVDVFDRIVSLQHEFMGLDKYTDKRFKNRLYCHVTYHGFMYAPNYRTAYADKTMEKVCNIRELTTSSIWGPAHEIGHINQIRPGVKWHGMTEVTNNIYALYVQTSFGNVSRLQYEAERPTHTYDNCWYERSMTEYFSQGLAHNANLINHCRLVPFWQLYLYMVKVKGNADFYKDLFEAIRTSPDPETDGLCQLEFVKKACDAAKTDLTPFFEKYGFFTPIKMEINDYGKKIFEVTKEQISRTRQEIAAKNYPKQKIPFWYISDNTVEMFQHPQPISEGTASCKGNTFTMLNWNQVAAYEVYQNGKLIFVSPLSRFTVEEKVVDPATELYAIGTDGTKKKIEFTWTEDAEQIRKIKERASKNSNMYKR